MITASVGLLPRCSLLSALQVAELFDFLAYCTPEQPRHFLRRKFHSSFDRHLALDVSGCRSFRLSSERRQIERRVSWTPDSQNCLLFVTLFRQICSIPCRSRQKLRNFLSFSPRDDRRNNGGSLHIAHFERCDGNYVSRITILGSRLLFKRPY